MKIANILRAPRLAAVRAVMTVSFGVAMLTPAFAAEPPVTPAERATNLQAFRAEIALTRSNIVATLEQLVLIQKSEDPHAQYQKFVEQLATMKKRAKITQERAQVMKKKGDAYFADWAALSTANSGTNGAQAEKIEAKRKAAYDQIIKSMQQSRASFDPLIVELEAIKTLLAGQPGKQQIADAKGRFTEANWRCVEVQRGMMGAEDGLDALASDVGGTKQGPGSDPGKP